MKMTSLQVAVVLCMLCLLTACERNPVLRKGMVQFNEFLQRNQYSSLASLCSDYYVMGDQEKVTRQSATCSVFTRDMALQSRREGFISRVRFDDFRDKQLWQNWQDYMRDSARNAAVAESQD